MLTQNNNDNLSPTPPYIEGKEGGRSSGMVLDPVASIVQSIYASLTLSGSSSTSGIGFVEPTSGMGFVEPTTIPEDAATTSEEVIESAPIRISSEDHEFHSLYPRIHSSLPHTIEELERNKMLNEGIRKEKEEGNTSEEKEEKKEKVRPVIVPRKRGRPRIYCTGTEEELRAEEEAAAAAAAKKRIKEASVDSDASENSKSKKLSATSFISREDPKYLDMRKANNAAVKRNRDKAKKLQMLKDHELERLRETVARLEKELLEEKEKGKLMRSELDAFRSMAQMFKNAHNEK